SSPPARPSGGSTGLERAGRAAGWAAGQAGGSRGNPCPTGHLRESFVASREGEPPEPGSPGIVPSVPKDQRVLPERGLGQLVEKAHAQEADLQPSRMRHRRLDIEGGDRADLDG